MGWLPWPGFGDAETTTRVFGSLEKSTPSTLVPTKKRRKKRAVAGDEKRPLEAAIFFFFLLVLFVAKYCKSLVVVWGQPANTRVYIYPQAKPITTVKSQSPF